MRTGLLPFRVFAKLQPRSEPPSALSPRPLIHSCHSTPRLPLLQSLLFPVVHPISLQPFTKCSSRISFALTTIRFYGGVYPHCYSPPSSAHGAHKRNSLALRALFVGQRDHGVVARRPQRRIPRAGGRPNHRQRNGLK